MQSQEGIPGEQSSNLDPREQRQPPQGQQTYEERP